MREANYPEKLLTISYSSQHSCDRIRQMCLHAGPNAQLHCEQQLAPDTFKSFPGCLTAQEGAAT